MDSEVLPTMLENSNVTIMVDEVNNTEIVTVISYASEATVVTPAAYACNVSSIAFFLCGLLHATHPTVVNCGLQYSHGCALHACLDVQLHYVVSCHACNELQS